MSRPAPTLSVIIPFFNEGPNVAPLLQELRQTLSGLGVEAEVLCIDDGSRDDTPAELTLAARAWETLRVERFAANRGQASALWWGFQNARGTWIAMLDGDGQNPPAELARLWALRDTADMIVGARMGRRDSWLRRTMSRIANRTRRLLLRDGVSDTGCSLKLFRREVARSFLPIRTLYSFLPAFAVAGGWKVAEVPVAHRPRLAGTSKYGLRVMAVHPLLDLLALSWTLRRSIRLK
ncbi:MAG TPA: glycosyltransferase family 2 protein [Opitutaceae bacterium]|nr:glycosyltransferase family 2 protein [Opitutaceae bacterium]